MSILKGSSDEDREFTYGSGNGKEDQCAGELDLSAYTAGAEGDPACADRQIRAV